MDTQQLTAARKQVEELEAELLQEITEKASLLGYRLEPQTTIPPATGQKPKRKRRTKAEIEADIAANGHQ